MNKISAIHQFHHGVDSGDGVTNSMLFIQKLLRSLGFESQLYAVNIPLSMARHIRPYQELANCHSENTLLLQHHSMGHDVDGWLKGLGCRRALVYHNITPPQFFSPGSDYRHYAELGREQLQQWRDDFSAVLAVSDYNADDLVTLGYGRENIHVIPLLVDLDNLMPATQHQQPLGSRLHSELAERPALLFVGRIVENKRQHLLLEMLWYLQRLMPSAQRHAKPMLILAGSGKSSAYGRFLEQRMHQLHLDDSVVIPGKVGNDTLQALYRQSEAFVCTSAHEGFGMPLVEAMLADCPVVAMGRANIPHTLGEGGLILNEDDPAAMAAVLSLLLQDTSLREQVLTGQRHALERYTPQRLLNELVDWLTTALDVALPATQAAVSPSTDK